ncbi:MAG: serine/threonine-protein phosphatase, partial [Lachnospiraceae bacterium]|nr:serine/threonine-protein phosphatase [Lachnospiraceae bacterium]
PTTSGEDPTTSDEDPTTSDEDPDDGGKLKPVMAIAIVLLLALALAAVYFVFRKKNQGEQEKRAADSALKAADKWNGEAGTENAGTNAGAQGTKVSGDFTAVEVGSAEDSRIGKVHNIGRRRNQQDTLGVGMTPQGLLAVVSDGMGGLADGEKVSQTAVRTMLQSAQTAAPSSLENPLYELLAKANRQVLNMLGPDQVYKSGATLLAVLVANGSFHWVTVGDSRIYFYDGSHLLQMNSEHVFKRELIVQAVNGKLDFSRIESNNQKGGLVSFLGMGDLKYVEGSLTPVKLANGDRILLMSDGIFNTISEKQMLAILKKSKTAADAAAAMEKSVLEAANPKQDNFTCVILDV